MLRIITMQTLVQKKKKKKKRRQNSGNKIQSLWKRFVDSGSNTSTSINPDII